MKQATSSSFNEGLLMDLNPLTTPQTCLSDALNGTLITFNGTEFTLQSDNGNVKIDGSKIKEGYIPVGMKEYGGIVYVALLNPKTDECEIGSIPSPDFDTEPTNGNSNLMTVSFQAVSGKYENFFKLFEREQLEINPGDKYEIIESPTSVKPDIYRYEYKAIDTNENVFDLKDPNIQSTSGHKKPFNQTISSTIGLNISLDNIDYFDAYVIPNSKTKMTLYYFGENKVTIPGTPSGIYITHIRYRTVNSDGTAGSWNTVPVPQTYQTRVLGNIEVSLDPLITQFSFEVQPVSNYEPLTYLSKILQVDTETEISITEGNSIFKYSYSTLNKLLRFEFDYTFTPHPDTKVFVEFYDIWSDYSVVYPVEDPNPFGKNLLFIDVSDDTLAQEFVLTRGGIPTSEIVDSTELFKPKMGSKKIRTKQVLRPNNLYACCLHLVKNNDFENPTTIKKAFVLNNFLNDWFGNDTVKDMTTLANKQIESSVDVKNEQTYTGSVIKMDEFDDLNIFTDSGGSRFYYKFHISDGSVIDPGKYTSNYKISNKFKITADIKSTQGSYGVIELNNTQKEVLMDGQNIIGGEDGCNYEWNDLGGDEYEQVLSADRILKGTIYKQQRLIKSHDSSQDKSVWSTMYINETNPELEPAIRIGHTKTGNGPVIGTYTYSAPNRFFKWDGTTAPPTYPKCDDNNFQDFITNLTVGDTTTKVGKKSGYILHYSKQVLDGRTTVAYANDFDWRNDKHEILDSQVFDPAQIQYLFVMHCNRGSSRGDEYSIIPYGSKSDVIAMLKSIFIPFSVQTASWDLLNYTDIYDKGVYDTILYANGVVNVSGTPVIKQYYYNGTNFVNSDYTTILNSLGVSFNDVYLRMNTQQFSSTKSFSLPALTLNAGSNGLIKQKLLTGMNDLERIEANRLVNSNYTQGLVYSYDPRWSRFINRFSWDSINNRFKLTVEDYTNITTYYFHTSREDINRYQGIDYVGNNYKLDYTN